MRVADTLAQIHAVDPDAVGLGDLGRKEDYVARQLRRWQGQWEKSKTRELPIVDRGPRAPRGADPDAGAGDDRPRRLPPRQHDPHPRRRGGGGRRLGALHARRPARRRRHADGLLARAGEATTSRSASRRTWRRASPTREELAARYAERSGRDISELDFFVALGYWKLAIILEGVYARYDRRRLRQGRRRHRGVRAWSSAWPRRPSRPSAAPAPESGRMDSGVF